jgi:predicted nucleic acid-binding protein
VAEPRSVVNASPLIFLAAVDALFLLPQLAHGVLVPGAVLDEVLAGKELHPALQGLSSTPWAQITPSLAVPAEVAGWDLGGGETQVLALALSLRDAEVVLDDLQARRCARSVGLLTTGTLGLILRAKRRGLISAARPLIENFLERRFYLAHELVEASLAEVGE